VTTSPRQSALDSLAFAHKVTNDLATSFPEDRIAYQAAPTDNHLLWTLGHLAMTYQWLSSFLGVKGTLPESYGALFGGKSKPSGDSKAYPSLSELRKNYLAQYAAFVDAVKRLPESQLSDSIADKTGGFAPTKLDLVQRASWHEGWHGGQLSSIRRALNLPPVLG
jgi:hypothetical protein